MMAAFASVIVLMLALHLRTEHRLTKLETLINGKKKNG